ncbi:aminotransferase class V-fold PLP-dependent enzyme [Oscillibacter sp. 1-3]|uniref:aminotransferase class V-fold PLP-dependent enzyme n=1 Tax=Oscillibacter sp. 1-3 TaxID=1235797 RepID=UPI000334C580|nr:aminotransferase class V-fold PLP-dependent enzyme [Oscillibacter sp. 1-3]EOS67117.1 cysteine desulfurase [Oscillibacter sp. 1-3]
MAYFDNAATSYPKPDIVYTFMDRFYRNHGGSAGRGDYALANSAKGMIEETRSLLQELFHCPAKQVVFTPTATIALNMIIRGVIEKGTRNIYISPFEHNAVTRTLYHFEKLGLITITELAITDLLKYDILRIRYQFDSVRPDLVIVSHASNVIGLVSPVEDIFALAKEYGAVTLVDMAQTAGLVDLNVGLETIDFAVFAGHKTLLGPTGISGFLMKPSVQLPPVLFGGTGYDSANQDMPESFPEKYEMGTLNIVGIAGLNAALKWIKEQTIVKLYSEEAAKRKELLTLIEDYNFLTVVGNVEGNKYVGIVSCLVDGISSDSAGGIFSERGISVRTGLQCAPRAHQFLGTYPAGTVRLSVNALTADKDFEDLKDALNDIETNL